MKDPNTETRELSKDELDSVSGGAMMCGLPLVVVAIAQGIAIKTAVQSFVNKILH